MTNPIPKLSICIPTFQRAELLDFCLATVLPQVQASQGQVECVICDNASEDRTTEVIARYAKQYPLRSFRNETNIGILGNITQIVTQHAQGEHVLLMGDDDALTTGAVQNMLQAIDVPSPPDLIALNVGYLPRQQRPSTEQATGGIRQTPTKCLRSSTAQEHSPADQIPFEALLTGPCADFTASYSLILRKSLWQQEFPEPFLDPPFRSVRDTYPHAYIIAKNVVGKLAGLIESPAVVIYEMPSEDFSWAAHRAINAVLHATSLLKLYQRAGVPHQVLAPYYHYQLEHRGIDLGELLWNNQCAGGFREAFQFAWMMKRYPWKLTKAFTVAMLHEDTPWCFRMPAKMLRRLSRVV
ncbi:MAG: glycosyltransferase [Pirellulales bacterium]|nr:glycosyltransferase [Pirellulales bacterium]